LKPEDLERLRRAVRRPALLVPEWVDALGDLWQVPADEWRACGVGTREQEAIAAVCEFAVAYYVREPRTAVKAPADVAALFAWMRPLQHEEFHLVMLNQKHRITRTLRVSHGSLTASVVVPRDVLRPAVVAAAAAVMFVHNHPSGDPTPSQEDIILTRRLRECAQLLGIRVVDHLVIGQHPPYCSFTEGGYL